MNAAKKALRLGWLVGWLPRFATKGRRADRQAAGRARAHCSVVSSPPKQYSYGGAAGRAAPPEGSGGEPRTARPSAPNTHVHVPPERPQKGASSVATGSVQRGHLPSNDRYLSVVALKTTTNTGHTDQRPAFHAPLAAQQQQQCSGPGRRPGARQRLGRGWTGQVGAVMNRMLGCKGAPVCGAWCAACGMPCARRGAAQCIIKGMYCVHGVWQADRGGR